VRQVCYICKIVYGHKEPLDWDVETHGLCPECFEIEMKKIDALKSHWDGRHPNDPNTS